MHTGQHYNASSPTFFFDELDVPVPDHALGSARRAGSTTAAILTASSLLVAERPDAVLVYSDATTTLAGRPHRQASVPAGRVDAGLRSFDRRVPRREPGRDQPPLGPALLQTDVTVETWRARQPVDGVHQVGDMMLDASLLLRPAARPPGPARSTWRPAATC